MTVRIEHGDMREESAGPMLRSGENCGSEKYAKSKLRYIARRLREEAGKHPDIKVLLDAAAEVIRGGAP